MDENATVDDLLCLNQIGDVVPRSNPFTVYGRRYYTDEDLRRVIER